MLDCKAVSFSTTFSHQFITAFLDAISTFRFHESRCLSFRFSPNHARSPLLYIQKLLCLLSLNANCGVVDRKDNQSSFCPRVSLILSVDPKFSAEMRHWPKNNDTPGVSEKQSKNSGLIWDGTWLRQETHSSIHKCRYLPTEVHICVTHTWFAWPLLSQTRYKNSKNPKGPLSHILILHSNRGNPENPTY